MGDWFTPEGGRAAGPDIWLTARPAEPADDLWGILPVPGAPQGEPAARGDERSAQGGGHRGRRRLVRSPVAWAVLLAGLAVAVGGTIGLSRLASKPGEVPRPLAKAVNLSMTGPLICAESAANSCAAASSLRRAASSCASRSL